MHRASPGTGAPRRSPACSGTPVHGRGPASRRARAVSSSMLHVYIGSFPVDAARHIITHTTQHAAQAKQRRQPESKGSSKGRTEEEEQKKLATFAGRKSRGGQINSSTSTYVRLAGGRRMVLGDDSPASYIHMVQHLIERCMTFGMSMEECMETLSKRADVQPVVTSTVWKELEKENKEFFDKYKQWRSEKGGVSSS
ncbi:hypothetical protein ABZP36_005205 [Zizania latifolia]